ncbi:hypothetical protein A3C52_01455 [Candidatus Peribacteria bacterium RIFCSPHIGHO2_02_FULL_51_15]|nr:MAG: hypothetical protein A3C52_01455 [Candidatus Peribacteria bacterium RIFCSPHIGHO2_02_FULL_51_15]
MLVCGNKLCFDVIMKSKLIVLGFISIVAGFWSFSAQGAVQATIKIDQISSSAFGKWTLISEDGSARTSSEPGVNKASHSMGLTDFGQLTLSVTPPAGMSVKITVYRLGDVISSQESQQTSVTIYPNDNYRFLIQYSLSKLGSLGVTSDPSGLRLRMRGPTPRNFSSKTPHTFINLPAGIYTLRFAAPPGCLVPALRTVEVAAEERTTIHQTFNCNPESDVSSTLPEKKSKRQLRQEAEERELKPRGERK